MIVMLHVGIAIAGIVQALVGLVAPSERKQHVTYVLTVATFVSGTFLVVQQHSPLVSACMSGLAYLTVIVAATALARWRLAKERARR